MQAIANGIAAGIGAVAVAYATQAAITWARYGRAERSGSEEEPLLDRFLPSYEVTERHQIRVAAPEEVTFSAACDMDLEDSAIIRSIFRTREIILRSQHDNTIRIHGLVAQTKALGWGVLAEIPGRELVMGAVTQPWLANPVFRPLPAEEFAAYDEPGFVKIVWNLCARPAGATESLFCTETRAIATDPVARAKFRLYWSFVSPGVWLIRRLSLGPVKREAERRFRARLSRIARPAQGSSEGARAL